MKQQTPVEWLFEQVWITSGEDLPELLEQAKEMEEDYKYEAYKEGLFNGITAYVTNDEKLSLEELHNKTLNKKKKL